MSTMISVLGGVGLFLLGMSVMNGSTAIPGRVLRPYYEKVWEDIKALPPEKKRSLSEALTYLHATDTITGECTLAQKKKF